MNNEVVYYFLRLSAKQAVGLFALTNFYYQKLFIYQRMVVKGFYSDISQISQINRKSLS